MSAEGSVLGNKALKVLRFGGFFSVFSQVSATHFGAIRHVKRYLEL
jgi:hypothetical protein